MTDVAAKSAKQIAHDQRNEQRKADKAQRKVERFLAHVERQNQSAIDGAARRAAAKAARAAAAEAREAAALADATLAFAEAIEARFGIDAAQSLPANDNARLDVAA